MNKIITFILIILFLERIFNMIDYVSQFSQTIENMESTKNDKVCAIILNYNRPHNLIKSLPILANYDLIDEIIISHGHPDYTNINFKHPKIKYIFDFDNNEIYGGARRFLNIKYTKCDNILYLDDDMIPSKNLIKKMHEIITTKNTIVGPITRKCNTDGYFNKDKKNVVLIGLSMVKKNLIEKYLEKAFPIFDNWLKKYRGNCEDLSLNRYLFELGLKPTYVKGEYTELDKKNGYSDKIDHYEIRKIFCKKYFNTKKLM